MEEICLRASCQLRRMLPAYAYVLPLLFQAFLLHPCYEKSQQASILRLGLMPVTIYLALGRAQARLVQPLEHHFHVNFPLVTFATFHVVCLALEFGFFSGPVFPRNEKVFEDNKKHAGNLCPKERPQPFGSCSQNNDAEENHSLKKEFPSFGERCKFMVWLLFSPRGIGTTWAPPSYILQPAPRLTSKAFLVQTLLIAFMCHLMFLASWIVGVVWVQHPKGGMGVLDDYLDPEKHWRDLLPHSVAEHLPLLLNFCIAIPFGVTAFFAINLVACIVNLLELLFYQLGPLFLPKSLAPGKFDTTRYPSLFNRPWRRTSLSEFWSLGWHSLFRRHIQYLGGKPLAHLFMPMGASASRIAGLLGSMTFSGIFHEYVVAAASKVDSGFPTVRFFTLMGVAILLELYYHRVTRRKVGGVLGLVWMVVVVALLGRDAVMSWVERGLATSDLPHPQLWTWHRFLIPFGALLPESWLLR